MVKGGEGDQRHSQLTLDGQNPRPWPPRRPGRRLAAEQGQEEGGEDVMQEKEAESEACSLLSRGAAWGALVDSHLQ